MDRALLKLQAGGEEEEGQTEFGEQVDGSVKLDPAQHLGAEEDPEAQHEYHLGNGQAQEPDQQGGGCRDGSDDQ